MGTNEYSIVLDGVESICDVLSDEAICLAVPVEQG
jgi:hypothetical protein